MNIAENIARLRKERSMTQEALAEVIGVSAQTISKWENSTTYPDVALLPVIADVFGVTIDALYGREDSRHSVTAETAIDKMLEHVRETIVGTIYNPELDGRFADQLAQYRKVMQSDPRQRSVIENNRDVLYFREKLGRWHCSGLTTVGTACSPRTKIWISCVSWQMRISAGPCR